MSNSKSNETSVTKKGGNRVLIICAIIIIVLLGVVIYLLLGKSDDTKQPEKRDVVVTQNNVEDIVDDLVEKEYVPAGQFNVRQTFDWVFPDGKSASTNGYVENAETNTNDIYFDIVLSETGETIYESPLLPLGSKLKEITLDKDLDSGTYDTVVVYHLVDEDQVTLSTVKLKLKIIIEN